MKRLIGEVIEFLHVQPPHQPSNSHTDPQTSQDTWGAIPMNQETLIQLSRSLSDEVQAKDPQKIRFPDTSSKTE